MAKPLANGFPIGAVLMRDSIAEVMTVGESWTVVISLVDYITEYDMEFKCTGTHGTTFGGSPLACALGFHVLSRVSEPSFAATAAETDILFPCRLRAGCTGRVPGPF